MRRGIRCNESLLWAGLPSAMLQKLKPSDQQNDQVRVFKQSGIGDSRVVRGEEALAPGILRSVLSQL